MIFHNFYYFKNLFKNIKIIFRSKYKKSKNPNSIMSRNSKNYIHELQKQRLQSKSLGYKYSPSRINLQVIGNGTIGNPKCLILQTDHTLYMFNCGEGTQRLSSEHHVKLTKLENIFITRVLWSNIGGIPGTILTLQETGVPLIKLHGPKGLIDIVKATNSFMTINEVKIETGNPCNQFSDHVMNVTYVTIDNPMNTNKSESNLNNYDDEINSNGKRTQSFSSSKLSKSKVDDDLNQIDQMMIYICKIHDKVGALDIEKCKKAGIKCGPNLGKLKSGMNITLPNGTIIQSKDMINKSTSGPLFIVLECPNEDWIDNIVQNPVFLKHQAKTATDEKHIANVIIHFTPEIVLNNSKYMKWIYKFGTQTEHLIINEKNTGFSSEAMYKMQCKLNLLNPNVFPLIHDKVKDQIKDNENNINETTALNTPSKLEIDENVKLDTSNINNKLIFHRCKTLNLFSLRPYTGFNENVNVQINPKQYIKDVLSIEGFSEQNDILQREINNKTESMEGLKKYPRLIMLGTGSSIPNKIRNTSGILLQLDEDKSMIFDCGEGTVNQIMSFFGETEGFRVLKTIKAIYISHLHADHHLGFIGILKLREQVTDEIILLLAPEVISEFLVYYDKRFESIQNLYQLISLRTLIINEPLLNESLLDLLLKKLNISKINTVFAKHCLHAFAVAITLNDGRKICYSGDTMPCKNVALLAKNSFVLIHEATMEDDLVKEAKMKRHSTISQAIDMGREANVNFTLLTHFSQRYSKLPLLPTNRNLNSVGIAYDFMAINLDKIELLSNFYPTLSILFADFKNILKQRATRRELRKEQI